MEYPVPAVAVKESTRTPKQASAQASKPSPQKPEKPEKPEKARKKARESAAKALPITAVESRPDTSPVHAYESGLIGTLAERSLHAHLKRLYTEPGDCVEERIGGYWVDICRGEDVIEIQTGSFASMKRKLAALLRRRVVHIVHPVAVEKWITKVAADGATFISRRKSPKRGSCYDLFDELVSFPQLMLDPRNFSVEVVLIKEEELRCEDGRGSWRRKGTSIKDHLLLEVAGREVFGTGRDFLRLLPEGWTGPSTNRELAAALKQPSFRIARMTYCLSRMEAVRAGGQARQFPALRPGLRGTSGSAVSPRSGGTPCREQQRVEAQHDVEQRDLQGRRQGVDDGDGGNPDTP